jgi:hypothetical protein
MLDRAGLYRVDHLISHAQDRLAAKADENGLLRRGLGKARQGKCRLHDG